MGTVRRFRREKRFLRWPLQAARRRRACVADWFFSPEPLRLLAAAPNGAMNDESPPCSLRLHTQRFVPIRFVGSGGNGLVYLVRDEEMGVEVALKALSARAPSDLYRLKSEFRVAKDVLHPNLVELYDLVVDEWESFFTMEFVDGPDLVTHVRGSSTSVGTAVADQWRFHDAAAQLATAIETLHANRILHRDVKPSNVLVSNEGRVVVLDFGLSSRLAPGVARETLSTVAGTFAYMAPEIAWGAAPSAAADWYSVGAVLYEALTGRVPFEGPPGQMLANKANAAPPGPRAQVPSISVALDALVTALLDPEPERRPTGATVVAVLRDTAASGPAVTRWVEKPVAETLFVGRAAELTALRGAWTALGERGTTVVQVDGPSGIGKTELVRRFIATVQTKPDVVVLAGRCHPQELVPYKALDMLVDGLSRVLMDQDPEHAAALVPRHAGALIRLFPVLAQVPALARWAARPQHGEPYEIRRRGFAALRELLARLGERSQLLLWIDDLQWTDADSGTLLRELIRPPDAPAMLLILSYRSGEEETAFLEAMRTAEAEYTGLALPHISLQPLSDRETRDLAAKILSTRREEDVRTVALESRGSPFVATQLARYLSPRPTGGHTPTNLATFLRDRVGQLPHNARRVLEVVCVAAGPLERRIALAAAGIGESGRPVVNRLANDGLLRLLPHAGGTAVEVYHDRIRETITQGLAGELLRAHHLQLAQTLARERTPDPQGLFRHYLGAGEPARAADWAVQAADRAAASLAFVDAASLYGQAIALKDWDEAQAAHLREQQADALVYAGRGADAAPLYLAAAAARSGIGGLDLRRRAAEQFLVTGHVDRGIAELRALFHGVGLPYPQSSTAALVRIAGCFAALLARPRRHARQDAGATAMELLRVDACNAAAKGLVQVDPLRGTYYSLLALVLSLRAGDRWRIARDLCLGSSGLIVAGGPFAPWGRRMLAEARRIAEEMADRHLLGITTITTGVVTILEGRWPEVVNLCDDGGRILKEHCRGVTWERTIGRMAAIRALEEQGAVHEVRRRVAELQHEAAGLGDVYAEITARQYRAFWRLAEDDAEDARAQSRAALALWTHSAFHMQHFYGLRLEAFCDLYEGRPSDAACRLHEAWARVRRSNLLQHPVVRVDADILRGRVALAMLDAGQRPQQARHHARRAARALSRSPRLDARGHAWLIGAAVAVLDDRPAVAAQLLERAAEAFRNSGTPLGYAYARWRLGELQGGEAGRSLIEDAETLLHQSTIRNPTRWLAVHAPGFSPSAR